MNMNFKRTNHRDLISEQEKKAYSYLNTEGALKMILT